MKYSKRYSKLNTNKYTTIRLRKKARKTGDIEKEYVGEVLSHFSKILAIKKRTLNEISDSLLFRDTDCNTREEAYELIRGFYEIPIVSDKTNLFVFYMEKLRVWDEVEGKFIINLEKYL